MDKTISEICKQFNIPKQIIGVTNMMNDLISRLVNSLNVSGFSSIELYCLNDETNAIEKLTVVDYECMPDIIIIRCKLGKLVFNMDFLKEKLLEKDFEKQAVIKMFEIAIKHIKDKGMPEYNEKEN